MTLGQWSDVVGYEGVYQASDQGQVRRVTTGKVLKGMSVGGYLWVGLYRNGRRDHQLVHRIVLAAFAGPAMSRDCNHRNGDKTDNRLENLEWSTHQQNMHHAGKELGVMGRYGGVKLTAEQAHAIRVLYASGQYTCRELGKLFGVSGTTVCQIRLRKTWSA